MWRQFKPASLSMSKGGCISVGSGCLGNATATILIIMTFDAKFESKFRHSTDRRMVQRFRVLMLAHIRGGR